MRTEIYISEVDEKAEPFVYHEIRLKKKALVAVKYFCLQTDLKLNLKLNLRILVALFFLLYGFLFALRNFRKHISDFKGIWISLFYKINYPIVDIDKINVHFIGKRLIFAWIRFGGDKLRIVCHANDNYAITPLNLFILKNVNEINVISNYAKGQLDAQLRYSRNIRLIRNSYSGQVLKNINYDFKRCEGLSLCYFGRFVPMKGLDIFIKELCDKIDVKITIDLFGKKTDFLKTSLLCFNSNNVKVNYCGYIEPDDVTNRMRNYDSLLLPARVLKNKNGIIDLDGIPTVFQEAMEAGIPVITNDIGGIEEIIWHGANGLIMSRLNNISEICEIIQIKKNMNVDIWVDYFNRLNILNDKSYGLSGNR